MTSSKTICNCVFKKFEDEEQLKVFLKEYTPPYMYECDDLELYGKVYRESFLAKDYDEIYGGMERWEVYVMSGDYNQPQRILKNSYLTEVAEIFKNEQQHLLKIHNSNLSEQSKKEISMILDNDAKRKFNKKTMTYKAIKEKIFYGSFEECMKIVNSQITSYHVLDFPRKKYWRLIEHIRIEKKRYNQALQYFWRWSNNNNTRLNDKPTEEILDESPEGRWIQNNFAIVGSHNWCL